MTPFWEQQVQGHLTIHPKISLTIALMYGIFGRPAKKGSHSKLGPSTSQYLAERSLSSCLRIWVHNHRQYEHGEGGRGLKRLTSTTEVVTLYREPYGVYTTYWCVNGSQILTTVREDPPEYRDPATALMICSLSDSSLASRGAVLKDLKLALCPRGGLFRSGKWPRTTWLSGRFLIKLTGISYNFSWPSNIFLAIFLNPPPRSHWDVCSTDRR